MIVGFTGTQNPGPTPRQHDAMRRFLAGMQMSRFVHGAAPGCDTLAHNIVEQAHRGIVIELHPSNLGFRSSILYEPIGNLEIYPELPPLERNRVIIRRIHGLLAVPRTDIEETRSGTWATVRYAREIGLPIYVVKQNGQVVRDAG
jgi:predicted Rossmann fold nucleotide-binding protein DprA/Smf involved in DNA uptake